ncbi:MAG: group II intron reverse transcriptase/maturase [Bacteroidales bacterium]|nr:group II intron reverse transcriptase/maturase [Bacteroidales bacterium]
MKTAALKGFLCRCGDYVKGAMLNGTYKPYPVRRKEIPKADGSGVRLLGIPTVLDRFVQQAATQILQAIWDHTFSDSSFGYRPGRSQAQAVEQFRKYVEEGYTYVVNIDLSKFFDRVNHDRLMSRLAQRVEDKRVLKLIRAFLNSGTQINDIVEYSNEGTPQGGPLSPLLSNIVLDELDKELEKRGHRFVRYADDLVILVRSQKAGDRVLQSVSRYITEKLKLKVNEHKSGVTRPWETKFLGFRISKIFGKTLIVIHQKAIRSFEDKIRQITRFNRGCSLKRVIAELNRYIVGWKGYFKRGIRGKLIHKLNAWIVRRLKAYLWGQWKLPRTKVANLKRLGLKHDDAYMLGNTRKGKWRISKCPHMNYALPLRVFTQKQGLLLLG